MNHELHDKARALPRKPSLDEDDLLVLGRLVRDANRDDEDEDHDPTASRALLDGLDLAAHRGGASTSVPATATLDALLVADEPVDPSRVVAEAEALGALALAEQHLGRGGVVTGVARALATHLAVAGGTRSFELFPHGEAALREIVRVGAHPGGDHVLLALSDIAGARIEAALRGEPLERAPRLPLTAERAVDLAKALARAFGRPSLELHADLPLLPPLAARGGDLVLHDAGDAGLAQEVLATPELTVLLVGAELVVRFASAVPAQVALVTIERGEPGRALTSRGGATAREVVFDLGEGDPDGYALVVDGAVYVLRVS